MRGFYGVTQPSNPMPPVNHRWLGVKAQGSHKKCVCLLTGKGHSYETFGGLRGCMWPSEKWVSAVEVAWLLFTPS